MPAEMHSQPLTIVLCTASVLWLPYQALSFLVRTGPSPQSGDSPLGQASLLLLLALLHHTPQGSAPGNPFRLALHLLQVRPAAVQTHAASLQISLEIRAPAALLLLPYLACQLLLQVRPEPCTLFCSQWSRMRPLLVLVLLLPLLQRKLPKLTSLVVQCRTPRRVRARALPRMVTA